MAIEITPSRVIRSADAVRDESLTLLTAEPPDDPGNTGFLTSTALRSWRDRAQAECRTLAARTAKVADKLEASAIALRRADDEAAEAAALVERAVAA